MKIGVHGRGLREENTKIRRATTRGGIVMAKSGGESGEVTALKLPRKALAKRNMAPLNRAAPRRQ